MKKNEEKKGYKAGETSYAFCLSRSQVQDIIEFIEIGSYRLDEFGDKKAAAKAQLIAKHLNYIIT